MKRRILLFFALSSAALPAQVAEPGPHAVFEANRGQWEGDFEYRMTLRTGALFAENDGYTVRLTDPEEWPGHHNHSHDDEGDHAAVPFDRITQVSYRVRWIGASKHPQKRASMPRSDVRNYILGNDPKKWVANNPLYQQLDYKNVYEKVDVSMYSSGEHFKYDFLVQPGGDPGQIRWTAEGTDIELIDGELHYKTPFEDDVIERRPVAYQVINGRRYHVPVSYKLTNGVVSFQLGHYDPDYLLVIDPIVVFCSFSGSIADNWGFTATYSPDGSLYGGGICFGVGYPTTLGAYDRNYNSGTAPGVFIDIAISKFSPDGSNLLYATYLGGSGNEHPHSMIVNSQGNLVVFGSTGSSNFPMTPGAAISSFSGGPIAYPFDESNAGDYHYRFENGVDCYVAILSANGSNLLGSSYIGGSASDGLNQNIQRNYGDASRGEVVLDGSDNIYITTTTFSSDYPLINTNVSSKSGACDAAITKFSPNANTIIWSTLYGGSGSDQGYGIKVNNAGEVYITGATNSANLSETQNGLNTNFQGIVDGFIAKLQSNGNLDVATYIGTPSYDQSFMIQLDRNGAVYIFGQTQGSYPETPGKWRFGNGNLFIHKLTPNLSATVFSTAFGSGANSLMNLVPTAFNVDDCLNIMISGWGGNVNTGGNNLGGNTYGLPTTADAFQNTTDGSDFYFIVLSRDAGSLKYATFFGGNVSEHVDGGTSRFSPEGEIYQAVCAGCAGSSSFPTTPGAYSPTNPSPRCNLGVIKVNFETNIRAAIDIDFTADIDTLCNTLRVKFTNNSRNANTFQWDFDNGQTSTQPEPTIDFTTFGSYTIRLIAIDTICQVSDTAFLVLDHFKGADAHANFDILYNFCDKERTITLTNKSRGATNYHWDFGNGATSTDFEPVYSYPADGVYTLTLVAENNICDKFDTITAEVNFVTNIPPPLVQITPLACKNGRFAPLYLNDSSYYRYLWEWEDGSTSTEKFPDTKVPRSGQQVIKLTITDPRCGNIYRYSFDVDITRLDDRVFIPNAFTPNGDGENDIFLIRGNECLKRTRLYIYNRWGQEVFVTEKPFEEFWDGRTNNALKEDTYIYRFLSEDGEISGTVTIFP